MRYRVLAEMVVVWHLAFIVFVFLGGLLALWRRWVAWFHLPTALWAAWIEFAGWICPLTPLENWLRGRGGAGAYSGGFVEHYVVPLVYPAGLTRRAQFALGALVLCVNLVIYGFLFRGRAARSRGRRGTNVL